MTLRPVPDLLFSENLPAESPLAGCFALTRGLNGHAEPFSTDDLFGPDALLGPTKPASPLSHDEMFRVSAPVYFCHKVTSTFNVADALAKKGLLPAWSAVLATQQSAGRGQFRRHWHSPRGNLHVTFRLPNASLFNTEAAALFTGMLLTSALFHLGYQSQLKWPNDILNAEQKKAAGILVEKRNDVLLAGVGINLHTLPDEVQLRSDRATAAGLLGPSDGTDSQLSPFALWKALVNEAISLYSHRLTQPADKILPDMADRFLAWKGKAVTLTDADGNTLSGILKGVSPAGGLLIKQANGSIHERLSGSLARA